MAIQLNAQRIRFACDASNAIQNTINDAITGKAITLPSGSAFQIEAVFSFGPLNDANLLDLSVYSAINVQLQANVDPHAGTVYYAGQIVAANFNLACTAEQWATVAAASSHISLFVPSAQNVVPATAANFWLCIYGVSTDAAQDLVLLFAVNIAGKDSGVPNVNPALPQTFKVGAKMPFTCSDGNTRDVTIQQAPNGRWTLFIGNPYNGPGQAVYSFYCSDALYRDLTVILVDGAWTVDVNPAGHS